VIVRINQLDPRRAEQEAGWGTHGSTGPIKGWPEGVHAYEVLILERDEMNKVLAEGFRQQQLRQLIPEAAAALREPGEQLVVRLDGPLATRQLTPAFAYLTESDGRGRFALSEARKLEISPIEVTTSVRLQPSAQSLANLCADQSLGLERGVRLRAFAVPEPMVNPLLDVSSLEDERWSQILPQCGFVLSTARGLRGFQVFSRRLAPPEMRARLTQRLVLRQREAESAD
jgi:hypothetical protein